MNGAPTYERRTLASGDAAPVRPGEEVDGQRLAAFLRGRLPGAHAPLSISQFHSGHSNLTYLLSFDGHSYILRRPPLGPLPPTAHDMGREYRILAALWDVFPLAPRPYLLCNEASVIGAPFYIVERRHGLVVRTRIPPEIGADLALRRRVSEAVVDALVSLHAVDWRAAGLVDLGRPEGFLKRQIHRWTERYERAKTRDIPGFPKLAQWLCERIPPSPEPTVLHNDFKLDNLMLDRADPGRVTSVLDWEMATVGDPLVDLGILLCHWAEAEDPAVRQNLVGPVTTAPGFMSRAELVAHYAKGSGRDVSRIRFYETFALYKVAVIEQQIYFRYRQGQTHDARFARFEDRVVGLVEAALDLAETSR